MIGLLKIFRRVPPSGQTPTAREFVESQQRLEQSIDGIRKYALEHTHGSEGDGGAVDASGVSHNSLGDLQGGTAGQYNHLTDAQVTALHAKQHQITSTADHTSTATNGRLLKADANGLPVDATNTDAAVAAAVTASHAAATVGGLPLSLSGQQISFAYNTTDDVYAQYALLAGRSGGQTVVGGTAASNNLTLKSTSNATLGSVLIQSNATVGPAAAATATVFSVGGNSSGDRQANANLLTDDTYTGGSLFLQSLAGVNGARALAARGTGGLTVKTVEAGPLYLGTANSNRVTILSDGKVGVGRTPDTQTFEVGGSAGKTLGATLWVDRCDASLKDDITDLKDHGSALAKLLQLRPRRFRWKDPDLHAHEGYRAGLVAQEVKSVLPEWVVEKGMDGFLGFNPIGFEAIFVRAFQELQEKLDALDARLAALEKGGAK